MVYASETIMLLTLLAFMLMQRYSLTFVNASMMIINKCVNTKWYPYLLQLVYTFTSLTECA